MSLPTVSVIGARFAYAVGRSPLAFGSIGTLGELRWLHLYRLTPDLVGLHRFAVWLWSSGRCFLFFLCDFPHVSMAIILSVNLTPAFPYLIFTLGAVPWPLAETRGWVDSLSPSSLFQDSVICVDL